jgi:acetyl esterase
VVGTLDSYDPLCRALAAATPAVVVSVGYRLAPEHPWPAAAEDAYAATLWASRNAAELGGAQHRLAVAGDSAGGNLAAVVALGARDRGGPRSPSSCWSTRSWTRPATPPPGASSPTATT